MQGQGPGGDEGDVQRETDLEGIDGVQVMAQGVETTNGLPASSTATTDGESKGQVEFQGDLEGGLKY